MIGCHAGFVTYLVFSAVQAAGDLVDVFGGFSLAAAFDPLSRHELRPRQGPGCSR